MKIQILVDDEIDVELDVFLVSDSADAGDIVNMMKVYRPHSWTLAESMDWDRDMYTAEQNEAIEKYVERNFDQIEQEAIIKYYAKH